MDLVKLWMLRLVWARGGAINTYTRIQKHFSFLVFVKSV